MSRLIDADKLEPDSNGNFDNNSYSGNEDSMFKCNEVLEILDELIAESEGK